MGLFSRGRRCDACRSDLAEGARFCSQCGAPAKDVYRRCPKEGCDGIAQPQDAYCLRCGSSLPAPGEEISFDFIWSGAPGELARKTIVDTEGQATTGSITVRFGHRALLLGDGSLLRELPPGSHPVETTVREVQTGAGGPRRIEVLYFDASENPLRYSSPDVRSEDGVPCRIDLRMVVELRYPERMLVGLVKEAETVTLEGLRLRIEGEVRNAVEEATGRWPAEAIAGEADRKRELASLVTDHMRGTFEGLGFRLVRVETLAAQVPALDEVRKLAEDRTARDLRNRERVTGLEQDIRWHRRRAEAWKGLRESVRSVKVDRLEDKAAFDDFVRNLNRETKEKDLLNASEVEELVAGYRYQAEDRERAREFLLRKIEQEQRFELERADRLERGKLDLEVLEQEIQRDRRQTESEIAGKKSRAELADYEEELRLRQTRRRRELDEELAQSRSARSEAEEDGASRRKTDWLKAKADAYGATQQARAEADVMRLSASASLSAEQISAVFAKDDPELARAVQELFSSQSARAREDLVRDHAEEMKALLLAGQQQNHDLAKQMLEKLSDAMGSAARERAEAGDREAEAAKETVRTMQGRDRPRRRCRVCAGEWSGDSNRCPSCGEVAE